jgi:hypothetical protein
MIYFGSQEKTDIISHQSEYSDKKKICVKILDSIFLTDHSKFIDPLHVFSDADLLPTTKHCRCEFHKTGEKYRQEMIEIIKNSKNECDLRPFFMSLGGMGKHPRLQANTLVY